MSFHHFTTTSSVIVVVSIVAVDICLFFPHSLYATVITPRIAVNQNAFHFSSSAFQTADSFRLFCVSYNNLLLKRKWRAREKTKRNKNVKRRSLRKIKHTYCHRCHHSKRMAFGWLYVLQTCAKKGAHTKNEHERNLKQKKAGTYTYSCFFVVHFVSSTIKIVGFISVLVAAAEASVYGYIHFKALKMRLLLVFSILYYCV